MTFKMTWLGKVKNTKMKDEKKLLTDVSFWGFPLEVTGSRAATIAVLNIRRQLHLVPFSLSTKQIASLLAAS